VDEVQIDLVHAEPLQAGPQLAFGIPPARPELGGQEDLLAGHSGGAEVVCSPAMASSPTN